MLLNSFFSHWEQVRNDLISTIEAFEECELEYIPFEGSRQVGDIMLHIADAEDGGISGLCGRISSNIQYHDSVG